MLGVLQLVTSEAREVAVHEVREECAVSYREGQGRGGEGVKRWAEEERQASKTEEQVLQRKSQERNFWC